MTEQPPSPEPAPTEPVAATPAHAAPPPPYAPPLPSVAPPVAVRHDAWRASLPALAVFAAGTLFGVLLSWGVAEAVNDGPDEVRIVRDGGGSFPGDRGPFGR